MSKINHPNSVKKRRIWIKKRRRNQGAGRGEVGGRAAGEAPGAQVQLQMNYIKPPGYEMAPILHNPMSKPEVKGTVMNLTHGPTTQLISSQQRLDKKAKVTKLSLLM